VLRSRVWYDGVRDVLGNGIEQGTDIGAQGRGADGDGERDEDKEHRVFSRCDTALVPVEQGDQAEHVRNPLQSKQAADIDGGPLSFGSGTELNHASVNAMPYCRQKRVQVDNF
jgi:phosphopantothenate synthetase